MGTQETATRRFVSTLVVVGLLSIPVVLIILLVIFLGRDRPSHIDLRGGHSLVFKISADAKNPEDLVERTMEVLKHRTDPGGRYGLEWRALAPDRFEVVMPLALEDSRKARAAYSDAMSALEEKNGRLRYLRMALERDLAPPDPSSPPDAQAGRRKRERFREALARLKAAHSDQAGEIQKVVDLYRKWGAVRKYLDHPADLKRLILMVMAGVLEFRAAPYSPQSGETSALPAEQRDTYLRQFKSEGPEAGRNRGDPYQWFRIHGDPEGYERLILQQDVIGDYWILLSNRPDDTLLRGDWKLTSAYPTTDTRTMTPAVGFDFDVRGATSFARLTSSHLNHAMAALLDDEVYSVPVIQSVISDRGIITGRFSQDEVRDLVRTLNAGSLPPRLNPEPLSERTFGPRVKNTKP